MKNENLPRVEFNETTNEIEVVYRVAKHTLRKVVTKEVSMAFGALSFAQHPGQDKVAIVITKNNEVD